MTETGNALSVEMQLGAIVAAGFEIGRQGGGIVSHERHNACNPLSI